MDTSALSTANALSAANAVGVPTPALPGALNELKEAVIDTAEKAASPIAKSLSITPDGVEKKPAEAHADAALDQANATVESAVVSGTAAEKIAAKSAELVCAELRKNAANIWQQAANAIIDHLDTPEVMGKFSNSVCEAVIEHIPKSLTKVIESDTKAAATIMVDVIGSIGKLDVRKYQNEIKQYTRGESVNTLSAVVNKQPQRLAPPPVPGAVETVATPEAVAPVAAPAQSPAPAQAQESVQATVQIPATTKEAVKNLSDAAKATLASPAQPITEEQQEKMKEQAKPDEASGFKAGGNKKTCRYKGGAIYSFEPELRFIRAMARKSKKFNLKTRSTKKNKRKSRRLRK